MNAREFLKKFVCEMVAQNPTDIGPLYTAKVREVLFDVGKDADFWVNCEKFSRNGKDVGCGEHKELDFTYWQKDQDRWEGDYTYFQPVVIIEHENDWSDAAKSYDLWKVCLFIAPLRVFIGYCKTKEQAKSSAVKLQTFYDEHELKQLSDGETLILISWLRAKQTEWFASVKKGQGEWESLGENHKADGKPVE